MVWGGHEEMEGDGGGGGHGREWGAQGFWERSENLKLDPQCNQVLTQLNNFLFWLIKTSSVADDDICLV